MIRECQVKENLDRKIWVCCDTNRIVTAQSFEMGKIFVRFGGTLTEVMVAWKGLDKLIMTMSFLKFTGTRKQKLKGKRYSFNLF